MDECSQCGFVLFPGERTCTECGFGGPEWTPDDDDRDDGPGPYIAAKDGSTEAYVGP